MHACPTPGTRAAVRTSASRGGSASSEDVRVACACVCGSGSGAVVVSGAAEGVACKGVVLFQFATYLRVFVYVVLGAFRRTGGRAGRWGGI
eukprot:5190515-Pleurochrysis_carterae.AAC.1